MVFSGLYSAIVGALSFLLSFPALRLRASFHIPLSRDFSYIERLICTFTPNGRREFVPRDKVFSLFSVYSFLLLHKNKYFYANFNHRNRSGLFCICLFSILRNSHLESDVCRLR